MDVLARHPELRTPKKGEGTKDKDASRENYGPRASGAPKGNKILKTDVIDQLATSMGIERDRAEGVVRIVGSQKAKLYAEWRSDYCLTKDDVKSMITAFQSRGYPVPNDSELNIPPREVSDIYSDLKGYFITAPISPNDVLRFAGATVFLYRHLL